MFKFIKSLFPIIAISVILSACSMVEDIKVDDSENINIKVNLIDKNELIKTDETFMEREKEVEKEKKEKKTPKKRRRLTKKKLSMEKNKKKYSVSEGPLNVRKEASSDSELMGQLQTGDVIEALEEKEVAGEAWVKFSKDDLSGWVSVKYLSVDIGISPIATYKIVIPDLNVRKEPKTDSDVLTTLGYWQSVDVFEKITNENGEVWLKIKSAGSSDGFGYILSDMAVEE